MTIKKFIFSASILLLYLTISLACDPLAFRLVSISGIMLTGSALLYPALYTILDILTRLLGRGLAIIFVFILHLCDLIYTYLLYSINTLPTVASFHSLHAFNVVISPLPRLFWAGVAGALIAGIAEILIYAFFQKRIRSFFITSFISTAIILLAHNVPTEYIAFRKVFPQEWIYILFSNFLFSISLLLIYSFAGGLIINSIEKSIRKKDSLQS